MGLDTPQPLPQPAEAASGAALPTARGSGRRRWAVALGIVLIVAVMTAAGAFVLSGAGGASRSLTAGNAPKSTNIFLDLRTDLPGDQHRKLADFLSQFPGFADRALFDNGFDELLDRITARISPDLTYSSAFKSWTTGEISIAVTDLGPLPGAAAAGLAGILSPIVGGAGVPFQPAANQVASAPSGAVIVALEDRSAGERWVAAEAARSGFTFTTSDYAGTTLYESTSATEPVAYAFTDRVLIAGSTDAVKAGLDAPKAGSLADDAGYQAGMRSLSGDSVATFYASPEAIVAGGNPLEAVLAMVGLQGLPLPSLPGWIAGAVRADSDHATLEISMPRAATSGAVDNRESALAGELPGSTVAVVEARSLGNLVAAELAGLAGSGAGTTRSTAQQALDVVKLIGGIDWVGDGDLVVVRDGGGYAAGLVARTKDAATAAAKKEMLVGLLSLASLGVRSLNGTTLATSVEDYKGTSIQLYTFSTVGVAPMEFGLAVKGDLVVAGLGDAFVKQMLDTTSGTSLAAQGSYRSVMSAAGMSNSGFGYVDVSALVEDIGRAVFPTEQDYFRINYKPYLDHLGGVGCAVIDGQTVVVRIVVTAK